jgi:hypothetical protein
VSTVGADQQPGHGPGPRPAALAEDGARPAALAEDGARPTALAGGSARQVVRALGRAAGAAVRVLRLAGEQCCTARADAAWQRTRERDMEK